MADVCPSLPFMTRSKGVAFPRSNEREMARSTWE
jgi:hypothetical protein